MKFFKYLSLAFIAILLAGCGSKQVVLQPMRFPKPPSALLEDCKVTPLTKMETNAEILISLQTLHLDLKDCSLKQKALRKWYEDMEKALNLNK